MVNRLINTTAPHATVLIRLLVGHVFFSEGVQKFLFPDTLGVGRFTAIGIPAPHILAPFVGVVEITCGLLIVIGILTRLAAIPLLVDITVAILTTKLPILTNKGFWAMAHEARTDFAMLLGLLFLLTVGAGAFSIDHWLAVRTKDNANG
ncbi:MAG TPA: DoxX family protein [candidate division Zixibacteria bacterium]|nr:DoxX family protein [candidate division Zixibacteria bacterium]